MADARRQRHGDGAPERDAHRAGHDGSSAGVGRQGAEQCQEYQGCSGNDGNQIRDRRNHYRRPARYDDLLRIRTRMIEVKRRTIHFGYEILHDESGELLASGETIHVVCGSNGKPKALPEKYRTILENTVATSSST